MNNPNNHGGKRKGAGRKALTPRPLCPKCNSPVVAHSQNRWRCKSPLCRFTFPRSGYPKPQGRERQIPKESIEAARRYLEEVIENQQSSLTPKDAESASSGG